MSRQVSTSAALRSGVGPGRETRTGEERKARAAGPVGMMWSVPSLTWPVIPDGRVAGSAQPVVPAGGGLVLRPWLLADARAVAAAYADPAIQRWHARRVDSEAEARDLLLRWQRSWRAETGAHWAVTRGEDGEAVGRVALRSMTLDEGWAECAYWTAPAAVLHADGWHDMHLHARISGDEAPAG